MWGGVTNKAFLGDLGASELEETRNSHQLNCELSRSNYIRDEEDENIRETKPLSFFELFRYATSFERRLVVVGISFSVGMGMCFPVYVLIYGELLSLLVDRNTDGVTSSYSPLLSWYGGGRILINGTHDERMSAILEDTVAFSIGTFAVCFMQFLFGLVAITCMNHAAMTQVNRVRMMFLRSLLCQEMAWHDTHDTANVATQLADDLEKMQEGIGEAVAVVVFLIVSFISTAIAATVKGWQLALVVVACALIIIILQVFVARVQGFLAIKESESSGEAGAVIHEVLGAIRTVLAFGGEKKEIQRYTDKLEVSNSMGVKRAIYLGLGVGTTWLVIFFSRALAYRYGVTLIMEDRYLDSTDRKYTAGIFFVVLFGILTSSLNITLAAPRFESMNIARGAVSAVFEILERQSKINCFCKDGLREQDVSGNIEFENVHFRYSKRPEVPILQGLNLKIQHGQTVAIVGQSGCGKSTLVQLVQRLYDPEQGKVLLDGVDVRCLNVSWLRSQIGVVCQEPVLFDATIKENIRYGAPNASDDDIRRAAIDAKAHGFISTLPQGYQTIVGERGAQLSGGQKQRIAIARALVRRPAILLLDEATSALDRASEAQVQAALEEASRGRTTLVVAHRLSTVRAADRIVVVSDGGVVEQGTHDELMEAKGHYYELVSVDASNMDSHSSEYSRYDRRATRLLSNTEIQQRMSVVAAMNATKSDTEDTHSATMGRVLTLNSAEWPYLLVGSISAVVVGACMPAYVLILDSFYRVLSTNSTEEVIAKSNIHCIWFVVVGIFAGIGNFLQSYTFGVAGVRLTNRLRTSAFASMLRQEVGWFDDERNSVGALCARLARDAPSVQGVTKLCFLIFLQSTSTLIISVGIALNFSWKITLISLVSVPITLCSIFMEHKLMKKHAIAEKRALEEATRVAVEGVWQLRTFASLGAEQTVLDRYQRELDQALTAGRRKVRFQGIVFGMKTCMICMCYALAYWYGGILIATEDQPYDSVIISADSIVFSVWLLSQCIAHAPNFTAARLSASRVFSLLDREPKLKIPSDCKDRNNLHGDITYSGVKFAYPSRPDAKILRGLDLIVRPGQTVALVGGSGCGKSTCIQLLQRFYDPDAGQIRMGEQQIDGIPLRQIRREMGIVSQEPVLFDRTIAENIAYGDNERTPDMNEIISVAKNASIHSFIATLPLGYNTRLGGKGTQLSGGQKQRIAIARALLRNPRLLLLDEATSALDSQSEKVVQAALEQAREGRTCITIAHRLATIQNADLICVLDKGIVAEAGTHLELMQKGGIYTRMQR